MNGTTLKPPSLDRIIIPYSVLNKLLPPLEALIRSIIGADSVGFVVPAGPPVPLDAPASNVATPAPRPLIPPDTGRPVAFVSVPPEGVPSGPPLYSIVLAPLGTVTISPTPPTLPRPPLSPVMGVAMLDGMLNFILRSGFPRDIPSRSAHRRHAHRTHPIVDDDQPAGAVVRRSPAWKDEAE